jgi:hypothetical protein
MTHHTGKSFHKTYGSREVIAMHAKRISWTCALSLALVGAAVSHAQQKMAGAYGQETTSSASQNAIPEGTRFIIKLKDTLDTKKLEVGKHFKAELREDLVTPSGLIVPKGKSVKGHVAAFERGYTGARLTLATDELETRKGWVPLIATITGVPGDPTIKSTGQEGQITRQGPDKKRAAIDAAIGAGVGAAEGGVSGGKEGAAKGARSGMNPGTALLLQGNELKLDKGTQLEVRLDRELVVPTR